MDAVTFQKEAMRLQTLLYHVSFSILRNDQDCADAVQETLMLAWQHREDLREGASFKPWLTRILVNTCNTMLRKRARARLVLLDEVIVPTGDADTLPLRDALDRLPQDLRVATVLHYLEGFSVREIAEMLDTPENTVKMRLMRARRRLRGMLSEEEVIG